MLSACLNQQKLKASVYLVLTSNYFFSRICRLTGRINSMSNDSFMWRNDTGNWMGQVVRRSYFGLETEVRRNERSRCIKHLARNVFIWKLNNLCIR